MTESNETTVSLTLDEAKALKTFTEQLAEGHPTAEAAEIAASSRATRKGFAHWLEHESTPFLCAS